ncbi:MAG: HAMP domain-containing histidine kinase [Sphingomonadaceae bacterium]|nr:HAMP domain-containing histidine kinase [Sphingomonadaceae bacterium]
MSVVATTAVPFDFPVSSLDVARALSGESVARQGSPIRIRISDKPGFERQFDDAMAVTIERAVVLQGGLEPGSVRLSFDTGKQSFAHRQFDVARRQYEAELMDASRRYGDDKRFSPLVFGGFQAAVQLKDGRWRIASRSPSQPKWYFSISRGILTALILMLPVVWWFSRRLARPIRNFSSAVERIGKGSFEEVTVEGPKEIREAATAVNSMQARISGYIAERTSMLAAIAHDLRTPLARLSFLAADLPKTKKARVTAEIEEMEKMISDTLDFVQNETVEPTREQVDLSLLIESVVDDFSDRGFAVTLLETSAVTMNADALMLRRVFANLLSNAVTYGTKATMSLKSANGQAAIEVRDVGPGMTTTEMARAFDPFYRSETSRNRATGGAGLGLAIAQSGIKAHGGTINLRNGEFGGLVVSIILPTG